MLFICYHNSHDVNPSCAQYILYVGIVNTKPLYMWQRYSIVFSIPCTGIRCREKCTYSKQNMVFVLVMSYVLMVLLQLHIVVVVNVTANKRPSSWRNSMALHWKEAVCDNNRMNSHYFIPNMNHVITLTGSCDDDRMKPSIASHNAVLL